MTLFLITSFFITFTLAGCGDSKNTPVSNELIESGQVLVWAPNSVKAELYLPTFGDLENSQTLIPPVAVISRATATPEQLNELMDLEVERPFEFSTAICDIPFEFDVLYLVITNDDKSTRRFSQYAGCGFSPGDGFFQTKADGFISNQQICDLGMSFGVMGFLCTER